MCGATARGEQRAIYIRIQITEWSVTKGKRLRGDAPRVFIRERDGCLAVCFSHCWHSAHWDARLFRKMAGFINRRGREDGRKGLCAIIPGTGYV